MKSNPKKSNPNQTSNFPIKTVFSLRAPTMIAAPSTSIGNANAAIDTSPNPRIATSTDESVDPTLVPTSTHTAFATGSIPAPTKVKSINDTRLLLWRSPVAVVQRRILRALVLV